MELKKDQVDIESGGFGGEQFFSISKEDEGMIFELLRSKMYSDPIGSICREVASNSRDANREVGKGNVPIKISIYEPNVFVSIADLSIAFEDQGPGISPERMSNIFLKYAASSKRNTNTQTGGFGLGAKTPFAYSDVFHIITVSDKKRYHYTAYIDETLVGKMAQISVQDTNETNGTKIIVPIKNNYDRNVFEQAVLHATLYWDVKPELKGFRENYRTYKQMLSFDNINIVQENGNHHTYGNNNYIAVIDGISYPLNQSILKLDSIGASFKILIHFGNGELEISRNRETLQYTPDTIQKIKDCLEKTSKHLASFINDKIKAAPDVFHAYSIYKKITSSSSDNLYYYFTICKVTGRNSSAVNFTYNGVSLEGLRNLDFNSLNFAHYDPQHTKPILDTIQNSRVLENPIYICTTKLDARRIETLRQIDRIFTVVTLAKIKFNRYDYNKTQAVLDKKAKEQQAEVQELLKYNIVKKFEDVIQAPKQPKGTKVAKPDYIQIPVRANMGVKDPNFGAFTNWASQSLKYDRNNDKFLFDKTDKVIYFTVKNLTDYTTEEMRRSYIGIVLSFFLQKPIIAVNERFAKSFTSQLSIEDAIKACKKENLEEVFDHVNLRNLNLYSKIRSWKLLTFDATTDAAIKTVEGMISGNSYKGPKVSDYSTDLLGEAFKHFKIPSSKKAEDALKIFNDILKKYPLLKYHDDLDTSDKQEIKDLNEYIQNTK